MYLCACVPAAYTCVCARACVRGTWQEVESINFLIACGFIIFASNALIVAFLLARAQAVQEGVEASQYAAEEERKEREREEEERERREKEKRARLIHHGTVYTDPYIRIRPPNPVLSGRLIEEEKWRQEEERRLEWEVP